MPTISKSSYVRGVKCPKALYLHFNQPEEREEISDAQENIFTIGHSVGFYAQQLFPGGVDASRGNSQDAAAALLYTREMIRGGQEVIYEAAFAYGDTLCYMDILAKIDGSWHAFEVKASTDVKDYHLDDVAFQYYVITGSGLTLASVNLVHINNQYVRRGELDIRQLFTIKNLTDTAMQKQDEIPLRLSLFREMLSAGIVPDTEPGSQCNKPYGCDFSGYCHRDDEWFPLCDVQGINQAKAKELRQLGVSCFRDIPGDFRFTDKEWQLAEAELENKELKDAAALRQFTGSLQYPLYYMDFETIMPAIPLYNENRPYQQIPFQYSLHIQQTPHAPLTHHAWLGTPPTDPRKGFIESLLGLLGDTGTILTYNMAFEASRLSEIARDFPEYAESIAQVLFRIRDLMVPFRSRLWYHPAMKGSYSIKAVLPALVSDLSYDTLEIHEGGTASLTYLSMYDDTDEGVILQKRNNLLEYCKMDTMAMVRLLEAMKLVN